MNEPISDLSNWLALLHVPGLGAITLQQLRTHIGPPAAILALSRAQLVATGLKPAVCEAILKPNWVAVAADLAWLAKSADHHILTDDMDAFPPQLREIPSNPQVLFVKGNPVLLQQNQVAIVGSRNPTPQGLVIAAYFGEGLAKRGWGVTSGLALGIDGAAHRGALNARTGFTVAVMGTGLNCLYPWRHRALAMDIVSTPQSGLWVSEFPPDTQPFPAHFPQRNRIISGLSRGVLVVEAAQKSGSLITARFALEQNREIFAIPGSIHQPLARGGHALIRQGAKLVESVEDILDEFAVEAVEERVVSAPSCKKNLTSDEGCLLKYVGFEATAVEWLVAASGMSVEKVLPLLMSLELNGHVQSVSGGYIRIN